MIDNKQLGNISDSADGPHVSIFIPHNESTTSKSQDRIRLKNALQDSEKIIKKKFKKTDVSKLFSKAWTLHDDGDFWMKNGNDLAIFISEETYEVVKMPQNTLSFEFSVGESFKKEQLQTLLDTDKEYYLLMLDHKDVKVMHGNLHEIEQENMKHLPKNMNESLHIDEYPDTLQMHNIARDKGERGYQSFHGQYNVAEEDKKLLKKFFRKIDGVMKAHLQRKGLPPLIIAGQKHLIGIYKEVSSYQKALDTTISKNLKHLQNKEILKEVQHVFSKEKTA